MTGYGKASSQHGTKTITVELRSLNSKQLDINLRVPSFYKDRDMDIRNEIQKGVQRGKVDVYINVEDTGADTPVMINQNLVKSYYTQLQAMARELKLKDSEDLFLAALRMPDTMKSDSSVVSEEEWKAVLSALQGAIAAFDSFRNQEGAALQKDITKRVALILEYLEKIAPFESLRIDRLKERLQKALNDMISKESFDKNRFEQELIFYLEKFDITEEKVRLRNHCSYFNETIKEENPGRKLGFITQEIGLSLIHI